MAGKQRLNWRSALLPSMVVATVTASAVAAYLAPDDKMVAIDNAVSFLKSQVTDTAVANGFSNCDIKGNISINSGEKIYHVRGQKFYSETVVRPLYGERWFCTELDAMNAGWRKAIQ